MHIEWVAERCTGDTLGGDGRRRGFRPLFLKALIAYLESDDASVWTGYGLAVAMFACSVGSDLGEAHYFQVLTA